MHRPGSRAKSRRLHSIVARVKLGRIFLSVNYLGGVEEPYSHCSIVHHATTMFTKKTLSLSRTATYFSVTCGVITGSQREAFAVNILQNCLPETTTGTFAKERLISG